MFKRLILSIFFINLSYAFFYMTPSEPIKYRIQSIDVLRGITVLIMTLDHCRDYFHFHGPSPTNMATTTVMLFFTRWLTHFCAPVFVFLSGVSAYLAGTKRTKSELSTFLLKRGLWLILMDIVVITFIFTFNPFYNVVVLEVLSAIGGSMVILSSLTRVPLKVIAIIGCVIFFGHDILDLLPLPQSGPANVLLKIFFTALATIFPIGKGYFVWELYAIVPWTGVMLLGYVFGSLFQKGFDAQRRRKLLLVAGFSLVVLFVILRSINKYGDPSHWETQRNFAHTLLSFLNTSKYPPSLLYLCMTLGPALILLSLVEHVQDKFTAFCAVYGNVPFFYFIVHFSLIRVIEVTLIFAAGFNLDKAKSPGSPFVFQPAGFGYPLWVCYLIWLFVIAALYFPCKWYGNYKRAHQRWWLSYL